MAQGGAQRVRVRHPWRYRPPGGTSRCRARLATQCDDPWVRGFVIASAIALTTLGGAQGAPATTGRPAILFGNAIGNVHFGRSDSWAVSNLSELLGAPTQPRPGRLSGDCNVDAFIAWPKTTAYFDDGEFVGYATTNTRFATAKGLRVGDTVAIARRLYGSELRLSGEQDGAWFAKTPSGKVDGFLTGEPYPPAPVARIATIDAGSVGCPAMSP